MEAPRRPSTPVARNLVYRDEMPKISESDERITRYLLGDLTEPEQLAIEREYFNNPDRFEELRAVENDLVDRFVRDRLSGSERDLFERHYLQSRRHRKRVAFAASLLEAADSRSDAHESTVPQASTIWRRLASAIGFARPSAMLQTSLAAAMLLVLVAGSTWLMLDRTRLNREIERAAADASEQVQREEEINSRLAAERDQIERLKSELDTLRQTIAERPPRSAELEHHSILSALLSPMLLRNEGAPKQIAISPDIASVRLQMMVDPQDSRTLKAVIRSAEGTQVWNQRATKAGAEQAIVIIPANRLPTGDYILTLSATATSGESEELGRYFFRVRMK